MPYRPLPDASFIQVKGSLDRRFRRAMTRLTEGPEYTREFILSDVTGAYWRVFTEYCGDISGRYLGAVGLGRTYTHEPFPRVDEVAEGIAQAQREDGHFNTVQALDVINYPLIYGHGRLLQSLVEYYSVSPTPQVFDTIRRLADYYGETAPYWEAEAAAGREEFMYYTQGLEGVVGAYRLTGDARHLDLARRMTGLVWEEPKHHSHSYISSLLGVLALYEVTGEEQYRQFVEAKRAAVAGMVTVDGGVTEMLPDKVVTEFCSVADWFMLNLRLWRAARRIDYLEAAERILFNALFFNQFSTGGFGTWHVDKKNGYAGRVEVGSSEAYWCCCFHGVRALYEALLHLYTWDTDGIRVNLFFDSTVHLPLPEGVVLRLETDYPRAGRVQITVTSPERTTWALHLRLPGWARHPDLTVNGTSIPVQVHDGYLTLERSWGSSDVVELAFEMGLRLEDPAGPISEERAAVGAELEGVSLRWGPVLVGIDEMYNAVWASDEKVAWTAPDHLLLPPLKDGTCPLPHRETLPVSSEWPGLRFETPAVRSFSEGDSYPGAVPIVLTPLARAIEQQPPCAPSVRTRYHAKVLAREEWEAVQARAKR